MATSAAFIVTRCPRLLLSSMVLGIAVVDIARYYYPRARWLAWLNRVAKVSVTGIAFAM